MNWRSKLWLRGAQALDFDIMEDNFKVDESAEISRVTQEQYKSPDRVLYYSSAGRCYSATFLRYTSQAPHCYLVLDALRSKIRVSVQDISPFTQISLGARSWREGSCSGSVLSSRRGDSMDIP